jgi:predicted small secreted protein
MSKTFRQISLALAVLAAFLLAGCSNDADVVNRNISTDADNFKIPRRITFINGITDQYLLTIEGYCSTPQAPTPGTCRFADWTP